ncbi:hypothetical protein [Chroococcidiopsis sp. CCMEE 29]|nr:hypothetical protein [Chroococcidiopsis sp. CCMEE 29]
MVLEGDAKLVSVTSQPGQNPRSHLSYQVTASHLAAACHTQQISMGA